MAMISAVHTGYTTNAVKMYYIRGQRQLMNSSLKTDTLQNVDIEFGDLNIDYGINGFIDTDLLSRFDVTLNFSKKEIDF